MKIEIAGRYRLDAVTVHPDGSETRRELVDWFDNLITDAGLDMMGVARSFPNDKYAVAVCRVGSGNTAPTYADGALATQVAVNNSVLSESSGVVAGPPRYAWRRITYRFNQGVAVGNLSEVATAPASTGPIFSRALILDGNGNPTTITVLPIEFLDVTYEIRNYIATGDTLTTGVIEGVTYDIKMRVADNANPSYWADNLPSTNYLAGNDVLYSGAIYSGAIGTEANIPAGGTLVNKAMSRAAYSNGSHYLDRTLSVGITESNGTNRSFLLNNSAGRWQFEFTPTIPKNSTKTMSLTFRIHWGRYVP